MSDTLTVIYNDTCPICAREVAAYRRKTDDSVTYVGLSEDGHAAFGLSDEDAARSFHVERAGRMLQGVEAFAALWDRIPGLRWLARLVRLPVIRPAAGLVYRTILAPALYAMHRRRVRRGCATRLG